MSKFQLDQTTKITFTPDHLISLAMEALAAEGHNFEDSEVSSTISKAGMVLSITVSEGKPDPVKRKPRKAKPKQVEVKESVEEEPEPEVVPENSATDVFEEASPNVSIEEEVAAVKAEAGMNPNPDFSAENTGVEAKASFQEFDFSGLGNTGG